MVLTLVNVVYVLVAVAMVALILFQRGSGAAAGSGFGAGASATVFGARGASNFLSKSTAILAVLFFAISLGMAAFASRSNDGPGALDDDLGVMQGLATPAAPGAEGSVPAAPPAQLDGSVPAVPEAATDAPAVDGGAAAADDEAAPAAPATDAPPAAVEGGDAD